MYTNFPYFGFFSHQKRVQAYNYWAEVTPLYCVTYPLMTANLLKALDEFFFQLLDYVFAVGSDDFYKKLVFL